MTSKRCGENNIRASGRSCCIGAGIGVKWQILNFGIQAQTSSLKSIAEDHGQQCQNAQGRDQPSPKCGE
jgi:hypothetical protein